MFVDPEKAKKKNPLISGLSHKTHEKKHYLIGTSVGRGNHDSEDYKFHESSDPKEIKDKLSHISKKLPFSDPWSSGPEKGKALIYDSTKDPANRYGTSNIKKNQLERTLKEHEQSHWDNGKPTK